MLLASLFFLVALIYSAAGFGGGSSYLALLSIYNIPVSTLPILALSCNIIVTFINVIRFYRGMLVDVKKVGFLIIFSIPAAFFGGLFRINESNFLLVLGLSLLVSGILLLFDKRRLQEHNKSQNFKLSLISFAIGFLSGLVGIGGGIFLSPVLLYFNFMPAKKIAAFSSLYILLNSCSGLLGQLIKSDHVVRFNLNDYSELYIAVIFGSLIGGSFVLHRKTSQVLIKKITGIVVIVAAMRILFSLK